MARPQGGLFSLGGRWNKQAKASVTESLERVDATTVRVDIGIEWEEFAKKYRESIRKIGESVRIKGFRAGKAPLAILEKLFGREVMMETAVESVTARLKDLVKKESLFPVRDDFQIRENVVIEDAKEVRYTREIEVLPALGGITFEGISLEEKKEVDESKVVRPENEPSAEYNVVVVSGQIKFDDASLQPVELKEERIDLSPWSRHPEEFSKLFLGRKTGENIVEKGSFVPAGEEQRLEPGILQCQVKAILRREVPPLDDELAKDFDFRSLGDMREDVRKQIEQDETQVWTEINGQKIMDALVRSLDIPLPASYRKIVEEKLGALPGDKGPDEAGKLRADIEKEFKKFVLAQVIAQENNLQVSPQERQKNMEAISNLLQRMNMQESKRKEFIRNWLREYEVAQFYKLVNGFLVEKAMESSASAGVGGQDLEPRKAEENTSKEAGAKS
jgi:trigger factor